MAVLLRYSIVHQKWLLAYVEKTSQQKEYEESWPSKPISKKLDPKISLKLSLAVACYGRHVGGGGQLLR